MSDINAQTRAWCRKHGHEFAPAGTPIAPRAVFCVFCGAIRNGVVMPPAKAERRMQSSTARPSALSDMEEK